MASDQNPYEPPRETSGPLQESDQSAKARVMGRIWGRWFLLGLALSVAVGMCVGAIDDSTKLNESQKIFYVILLAPFFMVGMASSLIFGALWFMQGVLGLEYKPMSYWNTNP